MEKRRIESLKTNQNKRIRHFYCTEPKVSEFKKVQNEMMFDQKIFEPTKTKRAEPVVFAPRKDDTPLFCVKYKRLGAPTRQDFCPIRCVDICTVLLCDTPFFSSLETNSGYLQVKVE